MVPNGHGNTHGQTMLAGGNDQAVTFEVELIKPPNTLLGVDIVVAKSHNGDRTRNRLVVERVTQNGLIEEWNRRTEEPRRIRAGDIIVGANGCEGDVSAISNLLRTEEGSLRITVQRRCLEDSYHEAQASSSPQMGVRQLRRPAPAAAPPPRAAAQIQAQAAQAAGACDGRWPHWGLDSSLQQLGQVAGCGYNSQGMLAGSTAAAAAQAAHCRGAAAAGPGGGGARCSGAQEVPGMADVFTFEVRLHKPDGAHLGIDVLPVMLPQPDGGHLGMDVSEASVLSVKQVTKGGVVAAWNFHCRGNAFTIQKGDFIVRVNRIHNDVGLMMEELRSQEELRVTFARRKSYPSQRGAAAAGSHAAAAAAAAGHPGRSTLGSQGPPDPVSLPNAAQLMGPCRALPPPSSDMSSSAGGFMPGALSDVSAFYGAEGLGQGDDKPFMFEVEIEKAHGHKLGIDVMIYQGACVSGLLVGQVGYGGYVYRWNQQSRWPRQVQKGDCIITANGISSWNDLSRMAQQLNAEVTKVRFTVQRHRNNNRAPKQEQQQQQQQQQNAVQQRLVAQRSQNKQLPGKEADLPPDWPQGSSGNFASQLGQPWAQPHYGWAEQAAFRQDRNAPGIQPVQLSAAAASQRGRPSLSEVLAATSLPQQDDFGEMDLAMASGMLMADPQLQADSRAQDEALASAMQPFKTAPFLEPEAPTGLASPTWGPPGLPPPSSWNSSVVSPLSGDPASVSSTAPAPSAEDTSAKWWREAQAATATAAADAAAEATATAAAVSVVEDELLDGLEGKKLEGSPTLQPDELPEGLEGKKLEGQPNPPPAKLLVRTLQLNDTDITAVLRHALAQRPWLVSPVEQALRHNAAADKGSG
eukprot:TRINITY_DN22889_c1_g1_i1.p1 TRINITY_DN22889_c1_g1~~TRINITY_DN22889_c1_g1_i1.p1  ORF type:complete len:861 (+),score=188.22 TRINITY_DN22889_c1_g1_i1:65-2647(+)